MNDTPHLVEAGRKLAEILEQTGRRLILSESCTAGLVSATLAGTPGISAFLCGSFVVYRNDSKARWIDVPANLLEDPGPVSHEVALAMATGALRRTPEADLSLAITGHLGPGAPPGQDGLCFIGWEMDGAASSVELRLEGDDRLERQVEAATRVLEFAAELLLQPR